MKRCLKLLTGVQSFKSTLNFVRSMAARASLSLGEATLQFLLCFLMAVGKATAIPILNLYSRMRQWTRQWAGTGASTGEHQRPGLQQRRTGYCVTRLGHIWPSDWNKVKSKRRKQKYKYNQGQLISVSLSLILPTHPWLRHSRKGEETAPVQPRHQGKRKHPREDSPRCPSAWAWMTARETCS